MAKLNLGRVGFVLRGEWAQGAYSKLDVVFYGTTGDSYVSREDNNTTLPTDATKWLRLTNVGESVSAANQAAQAANTAAASATAAAASGVRTDAEQDLNDAQKETARGNIGAASADDLDALDIDQRLLMEYIKGTRQSTTWDSDERAETLHKDYQTGVVIRADRVTFNYSDTEGDGIMETRTLYEGGTRIVAILEIFTDLSTLEDRITYYKP